MAPSATTTQVIHGHGHRRPRSLSLSLIGKEAQGYPVANSFLQRLPPELIASIVELALLSVKPRILASICETIHCHLNEVLYRTIVLSSVDSIHYLYQTSITSPHLLLLVKKLVLLCDSPALDHEIREIVLASKNLHAMKMPHLLSTPGLDGHAHFEDITLHSFMDTRGDDGAAPMGSPGALRRLRLAEPAEFGWVSPQEMLEAFGKPESLTHLQLSRKAGANEDNDRAFRDEVVAILEEYRKLQIVVVSLYQGYAWESAGLPVTESYVWKIMEGVKEIDGRVVILEGQREEWRKEDNGFQRGDDVNSRFWAQF